LEDRKSDRPGFVRLGMFISRDGFAELEAICKSAGVGQAEVLEGAVLFLPRRADLLEAIDAAKAARKVSREKRLGAKRELAKLSPEELAALLASRGSAE
jgi:hypothetical protein